MSSDPQLPSDDEIDAEIDACLRGNDALSKAYRAAKREQPAREIDEAVLAFAQQAVRPRRSLRHRWRAPLALAAVLVLGLGLVLNLWREPEVRGPASAKPSAVLAPEPVAESAAVDESAVASEAFAQGKIAQEEQLAKKQARQRAEQHMHQEQMQREAERAESTGERDQRRAQMARETAQRNAMQDAAPAGVEALPPAPPPPAAAPAPPAMSVAPRAAFAPDSASRATPLAKAEREALPTQALGATPNMKQKNALVSSGWTSARFDGFELGTATRADVVARYGEPESRGVSETDDASAPAPRLHYDAYPVLPGIDGLTEFYYEPVSQRLLGVRVILSKPMPAQPLVDQLGWSEPAQSREWTHPPCESVLETKPNAAPETEAPHYGVYPQRGAYLFQPAGLVEQIVYEAECSWP
ncbi:hypothetical protein [Hydrocarboniphaga effusa]|uniref:hypothetical protein n=1 Tax=Hydrocarboniphaga effusa TaxID=243629 RepID=UPI00398C06DA